MEKMKRVGLFVGIDNYQNGITPLNCAVNDAIALSNEFASAGYRVDSLHDCDSGSITKKIMTMLNDLSSGDIFVFYFSGHGRELDQKHYLAGVGSFPQNDLYDVDAFPVSRLVAMTNSVPGLNRLFILDCCRNDILAGKNTSYVCSGARDIALNSAVKQNENLKIIPPLILNSCSSGQRAYENLKSEHGYFTDTLLRSIRNPEIKSFQQFRKSLIIQNSPDVQEISWNGNPDSWNTIPLFKDWGESAFNKTDRDSEAKLKAAEDARRKIEAELKAAEDARRKIEAELKATKEAHRKIEAELKEKEEIRKKIPAEKKIVKKTVKADCTKIQLPGRNILEMVPIKAGTFTMGSPINELGRHNDEKQHSVKLTKDYWLGKFPVTQKEYSVIMGNNPSCFKGDNHPVENVSWEDAKDFCRELNKRYGGQLPSGYHFDLPTEAQWEYACRVGTTTALNNGKNPTSDFGKCPNLNEVAWYYKNSKNTTHPVGQKKANAWGLYDMHGNVWEWCNDWYGNYPNGSVTDPQGPENGSDRVIRGGGWNDLALNCRSASRDYYVPPYRSLNVGFRVALVPIQ